MKNSPPIIGCNLIDPELEVTKGSDYSLAITERSLAFLKKIGFQAVEFSHGSHWTEEECETVRHITEKLGLLAWSLHAWTGGDVSTEEGARKTRESLTVAVRNAVLLGVQTVIHHPCGKEMQTASSKSLLEQEAALLADIWKPGMRFALENMRSLGTMEYALALAEALSEQRAGICVDTGHAALGDLGPARAIRMAGPRLVTTHIQDNQGERDDHLPPGDGTIAWDEVVEALNEVAYPGVLMLELTDQPADSGRRPGIREELKRGRIFAAGMAAALQG